MSNLTEKKVSNLKRAYDKIDALGINTTVEQFIDLGIILSELAISEYKEGSASAQKIYKQ